MAGGVKRLKISKNQDSGDDEDVAEPTSGHSSPPVSKNEGRQKNQDLLSAFTEYMSALSSNKISTRNAFEVGLIDNLEEVVHMSGDSEDEDNVQEEVPETINNTTTKLCFTRASKAIEGASKIYGYRVEAIYDQTFNVLATMNYTAQSSGEGEELNQENIKAKKKRKINFGEANKTLLTEKEVTLDSLPIVEGFLDAYFLKISSLFDQAGAAGLLLANMPVDKNLTIGFIGSEPIFPPYEETLSKDTPFPLSGTEIMNLLFDDPSQLYSIHFIPEINKYRDKLDPQDGPALEHTTTSEPPTQPDPDPLSQDSFGIPQDTLSGDVPFDAYDWEDPDYGDTQSVIAEFQEDRPTEHELGPLTPLDDYDYTSIYTFKKKPIKSILGELSVTKNKSEVRRVQESEADFQDSLIEFVKNEKIELVDASVGRSIGIVFSAYDKDDFDISSTNKKFESLFNKARLKVAVPQDTNVASDNTSFNLQFTDFYLTGLGSTLNRKIKLMTSNENCYLNIVDADDIDTPYSFFQDHAAAQLTHKAIAESDMDDNYSIGDFDNYMVDDMPDLATLEEIGQDDAKQEQGDLTVDKNVDITLIKQLVSSILLPTSDFVDAVEELDKEEGEGASTDDLQASGKESQGKGITFRSLVTETLRRLKRGGSIKGATIQILFVCLLHVCNDHDILLRQKDECKKIDILTLEPEIEHLG